MTDYASGARLYQISLLSVIVLSQALQGWVVEAPAVTEARMKTALILHTVLGVVGFLLITFIGPPITSLFFGRRLGMSAGLSVAFGSAFLAISLNTAVGRLIIVPTGKARLVLQATFAGSCVGVPFTLWLSHQAGAMGGAFGLAVSEILVLIWMIPACVRQVGHTRATRTSTAS
jgi:PST family polysaccharide transporter